MPSLRVTGPTETMFAKNGDVHLAYQAFGERGPDMLLIQSWVHHVELVWDLPDAAGFLRRLASFGRPIIFDRRGTGMSDPVAPQDLPDLETQVDDALAVLDTAGPEKAIRGRHRTVPDVRGWVRESMSSFERSADRETPAFGHHPTVRSGSPLTTLGLKAPKALTGGPSKRCGEV
jgi:hypothetical protein